MNNRFVQFLIAVAVVFGILIVTHAHFSFNVGMGDQNFSVGLGDK